MGAVAATTGAMPAISQAATINIPGLGNFDLPPELDAFTLKCLSACPSQRYRSAERALAALAKIFEASSPRLRGSVWPFGHGFPRRGTRFRRSSRPRAASA